MKQKQDKDRRRFLPPAAYLLLFIGMMAVLVSSSFAWFSISANPRVSDMAVFVNAPAGIELAAEPDAPDELWFYNLSYPDLIGETSPLKPVTWVDEEQCFKSIRYGLDGRQTNRFRTLTDEENANTTGIDQYYVVATFYARTGSDCMLSLAEAVGVAEGEHGAGTYVIGTPVWDEVAARHVDAGHGADRALRVGFRVTKLDRETLEEKEEASFIIYEPNSDSHRSGAEGYVDTASITGAETLVSPERLITQSTSSWTEAEPVEQGVTMKEMGSFLTATDLFALRTDEIAKIQMYLWIEGQDVDCYGVPEESTLSANIQFDVSYDGQSGLVEIPDAPAG